MIDILSETVIPILDVQRLIPVSVATIRRWSASGKLETLKFGSSIFTSKEAVARMAQHGPARPEQPIVPPTRRQKKRQTELDHTDAELESLLGPMD